ncbi:MAG: helix-turn-helix transcriptional regulator [Capsulimonas sp.]|uniref:helix-turn-helix transcriptional regulator n=1 Tax=Capsulimonas sp. TaxID=2494211 RepID=UPI003267D273
MDENDKQAAYERRRAEMMRLMERRLAAGSPAGGLAEEACVSRYHFQRVFRQVMGETPGDLQRRLRLERAAHDLRHTLSPVSTIAFDAGYVSLEGFSRAFRRAYGNSPSQFRKQHGGAVNLHGASFVHYDAHIAHASATWRIFDGSCGPNAGQRLPSKARAAGIGSHPDRRSAGCNVFCQIQQVPWAAPDKNLREMLNRMIDMGWWVERVFNSIDWPYTREEPGGAQAPTVAEMIARLDRFYTTYASFVEHVKTNNLWEATWVDSDCEPEETFTYTSLIEAGLERGIFRRWIARQQLTQIGISIW